MQVERQWLDVTQRRVVIDLPESFVNHRVEVIVLTIDEPTPKSTGRRKPHPRIAGNWAIWSAPSSTKVIGNV